MAGSLPAANVGRLTPTIPIDQSIYEQSTTQKAPLGTKLEVGDRIFRYCKAVVGTGLAVKAGYVACAVPNVGTIGGTGVTMATATTGATVIYATRGGTASQLAAGDWNDGFVICAGGNLQGQMYKIKSHDLGTLNTGLAHIGLTLYDPIIGSLSATGYAIQPSRYKVTTISAATAGDPIGIPMIDITDGNFFWLQSKGPGAATPAVTPAAYINLVLGTSGTVDAALIGLTSGPNTLIIAHNGPEAGVAAKATPVVLMME